MTKAVLTNAIGVDGRNNENVWGDNGEVYVNSSRVNYLYIRFRAQ